MLQKCAKVLGQCVGFKMVARFVAIYSKIQTYTLM